MIWDNTGKAAAQWRQTLKDYPRKAAKANRERAAQSTLDPSDNLDPKPTDYPVNEQRRAAQLAGLDPTGKPWELRQQFAETQGVLWTA